MKKVDAIGIVTSILPIVPINIKTSGQVKDRRNVAIVDESGLSI